VIRAAGIIENSSRVDVYHGLKTLADARGSERSRADACIRVTDMGRDKSRPGRQVPAPQTGRLVTTAVQSRFRVEQSRGSATAHCIAAYNRRPSHLAERLCSTGHERVSRPASAASSTGLIR